jgi:hypothetical protein
MELRNWMIRHFNWKILGGDHQCIEVRLISSAGQMLLSSGDVRKSNKPSSGEIGDTAVKVWDKNKRYISSYNLSWRHRGPVEVRLYPFFKLGARWSGWSTPRQPPGHSTFREIDPAPIVRDAEWVDPRAGLDRCGKFTPPPPGFDSQSLQPLYRLRSSGSRRLEAIKLNFTNLQLENNC